MPTSRLMRLRPERAKLENADTGRARGVSSLHFLKLIEDEGDFAFWTKEFETNTGTCSAGVYRMLSIDTTSRIEHIDLLEMMHPDDIDRQDEFEAGLRLGRPMHVEYRVIRPDGRVRWIDDRAEVLFDAKGKPTSAIGVLRDITEIRELKQALERGIARQKLASDLLGAIECGLDASGRLTHRQGWTKLTGQKICEADGWGWLDMLPAERREGARHAWIEAMTSRSAYHLETDIRCRDGKYRAHCIKLAPLKDQYGLVEEWVGVIVAIERAKLQDTTSHQGNDFLAGRELKAARARLGWSREDLAKAAGVSLSSIRRLEGGKIKSIRAKTKAAVNQTLNAMFADPSDDPQSLREALVAAASSEVSLSKPD